LVGGLATTQPVIVNVDVNEVIMVPEYDAGVLELKVRDTSHSVITAVVVELSRSVEAPGECRAAIIAENEKNC
jgi:hypothetical protein